MALKTGDVLFTVNVTKGSTALRKIIHAVQVVGSIGGGGHASSIHVLLATGQGDLVMESIGSGLVQGRLSAGTYRQYRYKGPMKHEVRNCAVWSAEDFLVQKKQSPSGYGAYGTVKAVLSPFRTNKPQTAANAKSQQFGHGAKNNALFFCSNFVFRCYAAAGEACGLANLVIPNSHKEISPRDLEAHLQAAQHWQSVGEFVQP
ncbi:MAG TPA: hypothetical protein VHX44_09830 [Planctomycetota bacterium]|nr:hypothetical protein [Planctomycetota bacterium]